MTQTNTTGRICAEEYTVKRGDSFYLIAHKLGVPLRDLLAANRDVHPARLMVGDVLCIPREESDAPSAGGNAGGTTGGANGDAGSGGSSSGGQTGGSEEAPDGDSVNDAPGGGNGETENAPSCPLDQQIQVQKGQTVADIQLRNLLSRHTLESANPGVNLDRLRTGQTLCIPTENVACEVPETYTMGSGETLESLAARFGLSVARLLRANPCLAPQDFEEGTTVIVPRG